MIEFLAEAVKKAEMLLGDIKDALPKVQSNAINRSITTARAEAVRCVTKDYIITAGEVRKSMTIKKASAANPVGAISSSGSPIALSKFDVSPLRPTKRKVVLTARVKRTNGRKPIKKAFAAQTASGHTGAFIRAGKVRLPINQLHGPSIPQMLSSDNVSKQIENKAAETMEIRLEHEIGRLLDGGKV